MLSPYLFMVGYVGCCGYNASNTNEATSRAGGFFDVGPLSIAYLLEANQ